MKKSWAEFVVMGTVVCTIDFRNTNASQKLHVLSEGR